LGTPVVRLRGTRFTRSDKGERGITFGILVSYRRTEEEITEEESKPISGKKRRKTWKMKGAS